MSDDDEMFGTTVLLGLTLVISFGLALTGCWLIWQLAILHFWPYAPAWLSRPSLIKFGSACILSISIVILGLINWRKL